MRNKRLLMATAMALFAVSAGARAITAHDGLHQVAALSGCAVFSLFGLLFFKMAYTRSNMK